MVRETRYLLIGNLPESTTENEIAEYFKRYGKIQKVKLERKPEDKDKESDEKDDGSGSSLTATVAFTDIKSASTAHKADKKIGNNLLSSDYSEGFGATGSVVTRTHEPEIYPRGAASATFSASRKGIEEEADGFDVYYGPTPQFNEPSYPSPNQFTERGRPRERWAAGSANYQGSHGGKWTGGANRPPYTDSSSKDGFEKPQTASIPASSPTHSMSHSSEKRHGKKKSKSVDQSRSSSRSSRSSSSSSDSGSASSSKERPKSAVVSTVPVRSDSQSVDDKAEAEIEPGEREPLGLLITKLPIRSSDSSLRDGLFHEYKKYGKITAVQISGVAETRYAIISFKQVEDAAKAFEASRDKRFFGTQIIVSQHEGIEVEDSEYCTPEAQLDEHSPKATRTLFLGNLEKEITIEELKEKLDKYGEILDVDVKRQGAVSAYAFIQFSDITSVVRALRDLDGCSWGTAKLKVGFGKSMATPVIWLDNLADTVNEGFLCRQFSRFGGISHTVVDRVKNRALIFFMNIESAQYALPEMRNRIWNGKKIHIDFASRDCQEAFFLKMEGSGQLRPGERPDQRWMHKQIQNDPYWDENMDATTTTPAPTSNPAMSPAAKRGTFTQGAAFTRGRARFTARGRGFFRGRGGSFEGHYTEEVTPGRRAKQVDEFSQGSATYMEDDSFEQELREYGHSQRERRERSSQSPPGYDEVYYENSQTTREYDQYEKAPARYEAYRSLSPSSDREVEVDEEYKYKTRTPSVERYYYKDKYYEESKSRDRSHSSDSEQRFRLSSEVAIRPTSRSRSPSAKHKRTKELPISYRSQSPPTPTDDEPAYYHDSSDHSPSDFDSAFRKYDYKKRLSTGSIDGDKKLLLTTGLRKEIESKSEERSSRKRSYDQMSPKRSDSVHRIERQHSKGSRSGSLYDFDKTAMKDSKIARLKSEVHERGVSKDSPSSGSSISDVDPSTMSEAKLAKLHRKKQTLLDKLTLLEDTGNNSEGDSNGDTRHVVSKKARIDLNSQSRYLLKGEALTSKQIKERLKMIELKQSRKAETSRKKDLLREIKKSKSSDSKKDLLEYSEDENQSMHSPRDYPAGFMPKKRRKVEGEVDRKVRGYRSHANDDDQYSSEEERDKSDSVQRQISSHSDIYSRSRTGFSMDARLETEVFSQTRDESRRISSGSDTNKEHSEHASHRHRRHKHKKEDHITPLIPLGDDEMPDPETADPRVPKERVISPMLLPLPDFAQFIQFSPLPSPHPSPEHYSDLSTVDNRDKLGDSAAGGSNQPYQSPCFSPQSSSSKTHSPSDSPPSGSGSEVKANINSDSGDIPPGFPTETEQIDSLEGNKIDSLDNTSDPTKASANDSKEEHDSLSDNNSDSENCNLSSENLSIEERIRRLDEKWNQSQAVMAATPKVIPAVESLVNTSLSSSLSSSLTSSVFSSLSVASPITTTASPTVSAIYSKYRIRKKNEPSVGPERSEPSEIAQTILSKSSIFDQDSKRLGQIQDSLNSSKDFNTCGNDNSPKVFNSWDKTSDSNKELPMVTVPGSLMDRLGQSQNMSFPTLTVNNTFTNSANVPTSNKSEINLYPPSDPRLSRLSPSSYNNYSTSTNLRGVNKYDDGDSTPSILNDKVDSKETVFADQLDTKVSACDLKNDHHQESSYKDVDSSSSDRTNSVTDNYKCDIGNGVNASLDIKPNLDSLILVNNVKNESPVLPSVDIKVEKDVEKVNHNTGKSVDKNDLNMSVHSSGAIDSKMDTSEPVSEIKESHKGERLNSEKPLVKSEQSEPLKEHRTNNISETSSMPTSVSVGKRKIEDIKSDSDIESKSVKAESKTETITPIEVKPEPEQSKESKESVKTETKSASEKLNCSDKDKHANSSKSDKEASKEPSSKKQKTSSKDKHSDSAHKEDKHKKKDGEKKSESSHKSSSEKKDDKKEKHKSKADKDKKDAEKKSKDDKKESKDEKKKKSEKKEKKEEKKELKENKEEKKEKDKSEGSEKKEKDKSEKKEKEKHDKKEGHKHEKIKSPEKKTKTSHSKDSEIKDSSKENKESSLSAPKDTSNADNVSTDEGSKVPEKEKTDKEKEKSDKKKSEQTNKKEHKSSSSHKTKKSKEEDPEKKLKENKKNKDDHSEHKKKDDGHNRNSKDSPDKNKDGEKKETSEEKKNKSSEKSKENTADKCKEHKSKDKENKDKDPDVSKSKGKHGSNEGDKSRHQSGDKPKSEGEKVEEKKDNQKEEKKAKDADTSKTSSSSKNKEKSDSQKKSSEKSSKSSSKSKCNEAKSDSKSEKEKKEPKEKEKEKEKDSTPRKKECDAIVENGLTEEDMAIFAQFSEPYMSMYDKVKRRSTDKQIRTQQEQRVQKSLLHEYKRSAKRNNKKHSLSDITESSDVSSDEEKKKSKSKKKFTFSTNESDSSSEEDLLRKTSKTQSKKPKRILDIYSSDSEEEELQASSPSKKTSSKKKKNSEKPSKPIYDFDSISDSDNKTSSTKQARSKTAPKANKTKSKSKSDPNKPLKMDSKDGIKSTKPKTKDFLKNLFSDDSDDSLNSDSDSGSDILISAKNKKKPEPKRPEKKNLPKGSSIYTTSEESDTDDDFKPLSPPRSMTLPKSLEKKEFESDHLTSDADGPPKETKKSKKNNRKMNDSFDSDNMLSDPESIQMSKSYKLKEDIKLFEKINNDTILFGEERDKKLHKQKSKDKDKLHKDTEKNKINKILVHDIFSEGEQKLIKNLSSLEMTDVFHSTLYEKDKLPFNLTNKDNLPPILSDIRKEPLFKLDVESVRNDIPSLKDINGEDKKSGKSKSKKLKKENKKKKKNKEKPEKEKDNSKERSETSKPLLKSKSEHSLDSDDSKIEKIENMKPESESDMNVSGSSSARNLFEDMKSMKTPPNEGKKKKKKADQEKGEKHDLFSDSDFLSDTEKRKESKNDSHHEKSSNISLKSSDKSDIFDFREDEDSGFKPIKESHVKKADTFADNDKDDESPNVPIDIQDVEIEYQSEDHDARSVCPDVETSEVVIEQTPEEKPEKPKTKRKQKSLKADTSSTDPTFEAVSSLVKESKPTEEIQTDVVPLESPVSNEQELVIDEGVSLHVEDETNKAVDSIVVNEIDETALAVESILFDSVPTPFISEPVEPTPQLDQNYLQPEFGLPSNVPQVGTEVETTTATSTPVKGKKSRKSRKKSGQGDTLNDSSRDTSLDSKNTSSHGSKAYDLFEDSSTGTSFVSDALQDQNDDDDDGRLQIDFDPPKEPKLKKQRKPKQVKGKLTDAAALAAENKLDNLFGSFDKQKEEEVNRDSISSENSELERSKHEDLLVMDREDQRQDSDMMSPDERSTSDDLTSPLDGTKVVKPKRGRKPKAKDPSSMPIPRTNSPRSTRTQSPRSPRSADPKSPKFDLLDTKSTVVKGLTNDESLDKVTKSLTNVFDFDDNDETSSTSQTPAVTKQRKPRRKKGDVMQSPEHMHMFSPERKQEDKFTIGSPGAKVFSPEHKGILNNAFDKKCENLLSPLQPEEVKAEVKVALDDNKPPEPLFKAFFEGKKSEKDADRINSVSKRIGSPPYSSQTMSNVDKTIEDVAKGLFESTDDEASSTDPAPQQKRRQSRKSKDEEASIKSPIPKSPMVKSPLPKSPMGKSPILNNLHSPPMSHHAPLVLPGMGQPQIGEPQLAGHVPMSSSVMSPHSIAVSLPSTQSQHMHHSPSIDASILSPKAAGLLSPRAAGMLSPKGLNESPVKSLQSSPLKTIPQTTSVITTVASSSSSTIVSASTASVVSNAKKADSVSQLETIKPSIPGVFHPVVCVPSSLPSMPTVPASVADILPNALVIADIQKKQMEKLAEQQSLIQQQKINDQKQAELQKQQEHHVKLKEQELKQMELERQKQIAEHHAKLQAQMQEREELEKLKNEQRKKQLQEHHKHLQQQFEKLQRQAAIQASQPPGQGPQQPLLSPGSMPRPTVPNNPDGQNVARPPLSAHHQMPPGAHFGLPGQHPVRPPFPAHLATQGPINPMHLVQPLAHDKTPTRDELALKHQQLQQQIAQQQAQALAEQQAQVAKQQAQQVQAQAKQQTQQSAAGKQAGVAPNQSQPVKPATAQQQLTTKKNSPDMPQVAKGPAGAGQGNPMNRKDIILQRPPLNHNQSGGVPPPTHKDNQMPGSQEAANQLPAQLKQQIALSQHGHMPNMTNMPNMSQPHVGGPHPIPGWPMPPMVGPRPDGPPRQPGLQPGQALGPIEGRVSMPGPVPALGGNPQSVQRVSPHPPTKSPTVAQTAPNMTLGFSQHQTAAPRAPSPAVAKTAERPSPGGGKWSGSPGSQRPGQSEVRPRGPSTSETGPVSRPEPWVGINGPTTPGHPMGMTPLPRPAHQQPPSAHQQQPEHTLQLTRAPAPGELSAKLMQQQIQAEMQRRDEIQRQEMQRQQQLRDQVLSAQAQKEVQIHKERERAESLEREKREREVRGNLTSQSPSDARQAQALQRAMGGYPFVEPRPPSRDNGKVLQSPVMVDPRFAQQYPGPHPTDLRMGPTQTSAFSPAAGSSSDAAHMYTPAELQRIQQNGLIASFPPGLRILEPHMIASGHGPPYMIPGHIAYQMAQLEQQHHMVDGRPPSRGPSRPPSNQPVHTVSPTQTNPENRQPQNRQNAGGQIIPSRDPHPGDGSLLSLLQRYPVMWQGVMELKNEQCVVQMHFISGFQPLVKMSLPQQVPDGTVQPLRIAQRMRLEQTQLEGVAKRMQMDKDYCMMLALPCGRDHNDIYKQTRTMSTGFIQYLQQKSAAGIVNVADPGSQQAAYVVHIFPPCDFSQTTLSRLGFDLLYQVKDLAHLIVIIATVG